jgi:hypothetical protein
MPHYTSTESTRRIEEPGEYHVRVEGFKWGIARGTGNPLLTLQLRTDSGAMVFDNLVFTETAFWKIGAAIAAFLPSKGKEVPPTGADVDINNDWVEENLKDADGWVRISKGTTPTGKPRNEVEFYIPYEDKEKGEQPAQVTTTKPTPAATPTSAMPAKQRAKKQVEEDDDEIPF